MDNPRRELAKAIVGQEYLANAILSKDEGPPDDDGKGLVSEEVLL